MIILAENPEAFEVILSAEEDVTIIVVNVDSITIREAETMSHNVKIKNHRVVRSVRIFISIVTAHTLRISVTSL
jgi:hypothetical protein